VIGSANFSVDRLYRYSLLRVWQPAGSRLVWVMLNPSTADEERNDATIRRCTGFALNLGYGGIEVYNLFAFCATHPAALIGLPDPVGRNNDLFLAQIPEDRLIVVAW